MIEFVVYSILDNIGRSFRRIYNSSEQIIYPIVTYNVLEVQEHLKPKIGDLVAILTATDEDLLYNPNCDSLICLPPAVGKMPSNIYPTLLFWNESFWIPVLDISPSLLEIHQKFFNDFDTDSFRVDVIHRISVFEPQRIGRLEDLNIGY